MDAYFLGVDLFGVERQRQRRRPARPVRDAVRCTIKGRGVFFEWVTKVVRMLESAARAAGLAIKNFFEGVGCEIASWFGSDCKDRMVDAEVTQQEDVERDAAFTIPIATIWLPKRSEPPPPANLAVARGHRPAPQRRHPRGNRGVEPTATAEIYTIAHVGGIAGSETLRVTAFGREETFDGIASIIGNFGSGDDTLNVLEGVLASLDGHGRRRQRLDRPTSAAARRRSPAAPSNDVLIVGPDAKVSVDAQRQRGRRRARQQLRHRRHAQRRLGQRRPDRRLGNDTLNGGDDDDMLQGRGGADTYNGGAGDDLIRENVADLVNGETFNGGDAAPRT